MDCMLETHGLTKRFGRGESAQTAVADVNLHVERGRVYGLLGPNGAGKSTTLKMIYGMLRPSAGEIRFDEHPWERRDLYTIGSLIEEAPLYPNLTARENLRVRTTMLGLPERRIDEVLETVGLADTGRKRAGRFSMGMKQRLGLALALVAEPFEHGLGGNGLKQRAVVGRRVARDYLYVHWIKRKNTTAPLHLSPAGRGIGAGYAAAPLRLFTIGRGRGASVSF